MKKPKCDAQHETGRDPGADGYFATQLGESEGFRYDLIDVKQDELLADELIDKFGGEKIDASLALKIAQMAIQIQGVQQLVNEGLLQVFARTLIAECLQAENARYKLACFSMLLSDKESNQDSMRKVASHVGKTVAAVSKEVRELRIKHETVLGLFNKSAAAIAKYKSGNGRRKLAGNE